jgi:hypothetical protein
MISVRRKVVGSILDEVIGFVFSWPNPSSRNMALELSQLITEMSTRNFPVGKARFTAICEPTV